MVIFIPGEIFVAQAGAILGHPSISTRHILQQPFGSNLESSHRVGISLPNFRADSSIVSD